MKASKKAEATPASPTLYWLNVTPQIATEWLASPGHNRVMRDNHALLLADQMRAGEWKANGETIKRSSTGKLLDGQHRLLACTMSNVPFLTVVADGIDESAYLTIDTPMRRCTEDRVAVARSREEERRRGDMDPFTRLKAEAQAAKDQKRAAGIARANAINAPTDKQKIEHAAQQRARDPRKPVSAQ